MDPTEPRWRVNSSFSPPVSRRWDRYHYDGLPQRVRNVPLYGSSVSSHSKGSRSAGVSDQYLNHHHSASDGALSYIGSPSDNFQAPRWTPSVQRIDLGEFSTPSGGARAANSFSQSSERNLITANSFGSASPCSDSSQQAGISKNTMLLTPRNYLVRRPFMSKPVYPIVFNNPVSEAETLEMPEASNAGRTTPSEGSRASPCWLDSMASPELKFHNDLHELQKIVVSPEIYASSRRDGFRWSNASSYDFGYDGESVDIMEHITADFQRYSVGPMRFQNCGLCEKYLWQKSPWSSNRIVRNADMPIAGVLPCRHVFHADCLEEAIPKGQIHEPPCPLCLRASEDEGPAVLAEPLQAALSATARRNRVISFAPSGGAADGSASSSVGQSDAELRRNQSLPVLRRRSTLLGSRLKKPFLLRGKIGKELFGGGIFGKLGSSSKATRDERVESSSGAQLMHSLSKK